MQKNDLYSSLPFYLSTIIIIIFECINHSRGIIQKDYTLTLGTDASRFRSMNFGEESCMQNYSDSTYTAEMLLDQCVQALL